MREPAGLAPAPGSGGATLAECLDYARRVAGVVSREAARCDCLLLSGGVDTSFIALVHPRKGQLTAITVDLGGPDADFARWVASRLSLGLHVVIEPSLDEFVRAVDWVLRNFRTIDPVEVSADAVHYVSISMAKDLGCACVLSGDGGDELFAGYAFLQGMSREGVAEWVRRMALSARLPTVEVGSLLGLDVVAPLYSDDLRRLAPEIPVECLVGSGHGKLLLREYLRLAGLEEVASRPKTAVTEGSGSLGLLEELAANLGPADAAAVEKALGFRPPSAPHAWLALRLLRLGVEPPGGGRERPCPVCGRRLTGNHCRFCGAYVSDAGVVHHYAGSRR